MRIYHLWCPSRSTPHTSHLALALTLPTARLRTCTDRSRSSSRTPLLEGPSAPAPGARAPGGALPQLLRSTSRRVQQEVLMRGWQLKLLARQQTLGSVYAPQVSGRQGV